MGYNVGNAPAAYDALWLQKELQNIREAMGSPQPFAYLETQHVPIQKPRQGMFALADGTDWNPGSGAGYYGYVGGTWVPTNEIVISGANANGRYVRLSDGTQFTWSEVIVNTSTAPGGFVAVGPAQPAAFVSRPVMMLRAGFFPLINGNGTALYTSKQDFGFDGAAVFINTGTPISTAPSFTTLGFTTAQSLVYTFMAIGRWK